MLHPPDCRVWLALFCLPDFVHLVPHICSTSADSGHPEAAGPLLEALGDAYEAPCEGTAFYALQSCMNHSCSPNAHAMKRDDQDLDGAAVILAKQAVRKGDEIFLSYIDESVDFDQRAELLRDYGITCRCPRCAPHRRQL